MAQVGPTVIYRNTWPPSLPRAQIIGSGYAAQQQHMIINTNDYEPTVKIMNYRHSLEIECEWLLTKDLCYRFESFYQTNLIFGQAWFTMPLNMGGRQRDIVCHFIEGYEMTQISQGGLPILAYRATAALEVKKTINSAPPWIVP
jgi:hypothetical protein